jgi:DnaA family protein
MLRRIALREAASLDQRFITLWGEAGAGKSHLLYSLTGNGRALYLSADQPIENYAWSPEIALYLLDDCDRLDADQQIAAFALYNQVRDSGGMLVAAMGRPPAQLTLREDLRTRLAWGLVYQVHGLSDEEKIDALSKSADARGMVLSPGVLPYLLTHSRRDMQSLSAILDALDRYSLETQRPITMPLLRELLQLSDAQTTS